eukprot:70894_1
MLEKYIDTNKQLNGCINTYGFGYSLDTKLLNELAIKGNGNYSFIPDSSFVGTIFVSSISNIASTAATNVIVKLEMNTKEYDPVVVGGYDYLTTTWGLQINLGNVMYGQNKDIVIKFEPLNQDNDDNENGDNDNDDDGTLMDDIEGQQDENKNDDDKQYEFLFNLSAKSLNYISLRNNKVIGAASRVFDDDKANN